MSLQELVTSERTDKNTLHSYLDLYDGLFRSKKDSAKNILEIGILNGGSIQLWKRYFPNAMIYGVDLLHINDIWDELKHNGGITLFTSTDAYSPEFVTNKFYNNNIKLDIVIDDGPHTLESMIKCIELYSNVLSDDLFFTLLLFFDFISC